jgi:hypothetical protein
MQSSTTATAATTAAMGVAARAVDVQKVYGSSQATRVNALAGVTLDIPGGRFTAIMGPSGSGKSTLLHCLAGLDRVTGGQVWIGDTRVDTLGDRGLTRLRREQVGFVFQLFNLLPTLTAAENITLPLAIGRRKPDRAWWDRIVEALRLGDRLGHRPAQLSGGEQQLPRPGQDPPAARADRAGAQPCPRRRLAHRGRDDRKLDLPARPANPSPPGNLTSPAESEPGVIQVRRSQRVAGISLHFRSTRRQAAQDGAERAGTSRDGASRRPAICARHPRWAGLGGDGRGPAGSRRCDCKIAGIAYTGSNPVPATPSELREYSRVTL